MEIPILNLFYILKPILISNHFLTTSIKYIKYTLPGINRYYQPIFVPQPGNKIIFFIYSISCRIFPNIVTRRTKANPVSLAKILLRIFIFFFLIRFWYSDRKMVKFLWLQIFYLKLKNNSFIFVKIVAENSHVLTFCKLD